MGVVAAGMHADFGFTAGLVELAITGDVVVVADALAMKLGVMTRPEVFDGETLIAACCGAMDDDEGDFTHDCTNKVELMAVRMVTTIWMICLMVSFFIMTDLIKKRVSDQAGLMAVLWTCCERS